MTQLCKALVGVNLKNTSLGADTGDGKATQGEGRRECDVGVNSAAGAYTLRGRQRGLTACRFSEFIMNVLLFSSFSLTFLRRVTLFMALPSSFPSEHRSSPPSLSQTRVAHHPGSYKQRVM